MIETIHDVGECTSIEELQNQIDNYNQVIAEYKTLTDEHGRAFRDVEQDINLPMLRWMLRCPECKKVTVVNWKEFINE